MAKPNALDRRAAVAELLAGRAETLVVSGLGSPTYDVAAAGDDDRNYYLWGAMGGAAMMGLGLAIAKPDLPVVVITGDGEMLMGVGSFATIAVEGPANLSVIVLDNGLYGETGGQDTHTARGTNLAGMARAAGIPDARTIADAAGLADLSARIHRADGGPRVAIVKIAAGEEPRQIALRDGAHGRARMRLALGLSAD